MNAAKRAKYATLKDETEVLPIYIAESESGEQQYAYTFTTTDDEGDVVQTIDERSHDVLANGDEVIIDENGHAVTLQQLVENNTVEEVDAIEESDGIHTILHIVPTTDGTGVHEVIQEVGEVISGGEEETIVDHIDQAGNRSKTYYCTNCGNCYSAAGSLKLHMRACMRPREEIPEEQRRCNICDKVFNSVGYLKEHVLRHKGEGPRRCTRCYRKFVDEDKYKAHMAQHEHQAKLEAEANALAAKTGKRMVVKEFTCSFCSQNFTVIFEQGGVKRRYACDSCREKFSNAEMLKRHKQEVDDKREFPCERCGRKFVFEGFLQRHLPTCDGTIRRRRDQK